jgi:hypothetical protein
LLHWNLDAHCTQVNHEIELGIIMGKQNLALLVQRDEADFPREWPQVHEEGCLFKNIAVAATREAATVAPLAIVTSCPY